ncbi:hypothetical protein ACFL3T_01100 [Patescibacteria group bacterium]
MFKKCEHKEPFVRLVIYGLAGAIAGLLAGFVLGLGIWGLQYLVCFIDANLNCNGIMNAATFLGSGAGAFLGALLGGLSALKKK